MGWHRSVLVVANETATSTSLLEALRERAERDDLDVFVLVPALAAGCDREAADGRLQDALRGLEAAGIRASGALGDADPVTAVAEAWDPRRFDEVVVCTLPGHYSRWLRFDLPHRVAQHTGAPVMHVIAHDKAPERVHGEPPPERERNPLGPLGVLAWGGRRDR